MHGRGMRFRGRGGAAQGAIPLQGRGRGQPPHMGLEIPWVRDLPELCPRAHRGDAVGDHGVLALTRLFSGFRGALG